MEIIELNQNNFQEIVLNTKQLVLVDFWATWCAPCKIMLENINELLKLITEKQLNHKVIIAKLDIDNNPGITNNYSIRSIPTILLFKNGNLASSQVGLQSTSNLLKLIEDNL